MGIATVIQQALGPDVPLSVEAYDGSHAGPAEPIGTLFVQLAGRHPPGRHRRPASSASARAYVAGDIDFDGDLFACAERPSPSTARRCDPKALARAGQGGRARSGLKPLASAARGAAQAPGPAPHAGAETPRPCSHHYDVSNDFYRLVLGPVDDLLVRAVGDARRRARGGPGGQARADLPEARLEPGLRLLDVGCGWGSLLPCTQPPSTASHGRRRHDLASARPSWPRAASKEAGLEDQVEIRLQDYRDVADGPFDAISSVGMFEHVGRSPLGDVLRPPLRPAAARGSAPEPRHQPSAPIARESRGPVARCRRSPWASAPFIDRYVFPDGELHEVGTVVSAIQQQRLRGPPRREPARALRRSPCGPGWPTWSGTGTRPSTLVGAGRARVWRLYMAASAVGFERGRISIHQVLAVKPDHGRSGFALRPSY